MKYEFEKLMRSRRMMVAVVALLMIVYVYFAFSDAYDTFSGLNLETFWKNGEYRACQKQRETRIADAQWRTDVLKAYQDFVDANRRTPEDMENHMMAMIAEGMKCPYSVETVLADPYNPEYAFEILTREAFDSWAHMTFIEDIYVNIPLSEDPIQYIHDHYDRQNDSILDEMGITWWAYEGYADAQQADYWQTIERCYEDFQLVVGYSLGWDVLCSTMQFLPFTLGMAIMVLLGNLFAQEKTCFMEDMLYVTRQGRRRVRLKKITVALTVAAALWGLFQGVMFIVVAVSYGLDGINCTAMSFDCVPNLYALNWGQYYGVQCLMSFLGTMVFALFVCALSRFFRPRLSMPIHLVLLLITGMPMNQFAYAECAFTLWDKCRVLMPAQLMTAYPALQIYQSYNLGPVMLQLPWAMLIATALEMILLIGITLQGR